MIISKIKKIFLKMFL